MSFDCKKQSERSAGKIKKSFLIRIIRVVRVLSGHHVAYTIEQKNTEDTDFRDLHGFFLIILYFCTMMQPIHLSIPTPCQENWQDMTPHARSRFCASCQKHVVDFSRFSDRELVAYFNDTANQHVCGRFRNDQLDRLITAPRAVQPNWRTGMAAAIAALATLGIGESAKAAVPRFPLEVVQPQSTKTRSQVIENDTVTPTVIHGKVLDKDSQEALPYVTIIVQGATIGTTTDLNGEFKLSIPTEYDKPTTVLEARYTGYLTTEIAIEKMKQNKDKILIEVHPGLTGEVVMVYTPPPAEYTLWYWTKVKYRALRARLIPIR
jgi:hypothetical protein